MTFEDACRGEHVEEYLVCSHRWLTEVTADPRPRSTRPEGRPARRDQAAQPKIKHVWVEWCFMWQGDKEGPREITVDEKFELDQMLSKVNMLFLGCKVLLFLDLSYLSRFWTMYEAWPSHLRPTAQGLRLAQGDAAARCHIMSILGASGLQAGPCRGPDRCQDSHTG